MKRKDIPIIVIVVIISSLLSFFLAGYIIGDPETQPQEAEIVEAISDEFNLPDDKYFNEQSINPTRLIRIGDEDGNITPFSQSN